MHHDLCLLYESGELPAAEALEFERHMGGCFECRARLETVKSAHRWAETAVSEPPERLTAAVLLAPEREAARAWNAPFACACLLLTLSLARHVGPLLPGAAAASEDLERLRGDARRLEEAAHE